MRKLFGIGALLLITLIAADSFGTKAPYNRDTDTRIRAIETGGAIVNSSIAAAAAIDWSKMAALTDAQILVGNGSNVAVDVAVTGDVTISNAGVTAIGAAKVTEAMQLGPTADGLNNIRVARASFVCTTNCDVDTGIVSGVFLPAKAVIIRSYIRITTQFVDGGSGTIALSCEDANNIKTATDITGSADGAFIEGASVGTTATFVAAIASTCDITLTSSTAEPSAGALTVWVEYVIHD